MEETVPRTGSSAETELDILEIFDILRSWWLRIIALAILFAGMGYYYTRRTYVPIYTASALLIINTSYLKIIDQEVVIANDVFTAQRLVDTYALILRSRKVADLVLKDLDLNLPPEFISGSVFIQSTDNTEVMSIMVRGTDPKLAADIANSLMRVAPSVIAETVQVGSIKVVDYALVPQFPAPPRYKMNIAIGGLLGTMLGCGLALAFSFFHSTAKNNKDITDKLGLPILGGVPAIKPPGKRLRNKTPLLISSWVTPSYAEAYKSIRTNLAYICEKEQAKTIIVTSALGKEGKSTVAINTALAFAEAGKSVIVVDCDLRRPSISRKLNVISVDNGSIAAVLRGEMTVDKAIVTLPKLIDVLPSPLPEHNPSEMLGSAGMGELVQTLRAQYDYVIFDTPPVQPVTDAAALSAYVDGILFVVRQDCATIDLLATTVEQLANLKPSILGCVFNSVNYKRGGSYYKKRYYGRYYDYYKAEGGQRHGVFSKLKSSSSSV